MIDRSRSGGGNVSYPSMADTSNNPAVCDALHRGVDWDGLGALKAAARAEGYNKSSWKRAQSTPPNATVSVDDCALQVAGKLGVSLHDSRVALGLAESSQSGTNHPDPCWVHVWQFYPGVSFAGTHIP